MTALLMRSVELEHRNLFTWIVTNTLNDNAYQVVIVTCEMLYKASDSFFHFAMHFLHLNKQTNHILRNSVVQYVLPKWIPSIQTRLFIATLQKFQPFTMEEITSIIHLVVIYTRVDLLKETIKAVDPTHSAKTWDIWRIWQALDQTLTDEDRMQRYGACLDLIISHYSIPTPWITSRMFAALSIKMKMKVLSNVMSVDEQLTIWLADNETLVSRIVGQIEKIVKGGKSTAEEKAFTSHFSKWADQQGKLPRDLWLNLFLVHLSMENE
jgi:hypothetical protein